MYSAFISYSHAVDNRLAPAVQKALEQFAKPWFKIRNLNIFRDETSLTASPHLWADIKIALAQSEYLIYMASPISASSKWIEKEIGFWLENKSLEKILIILTAGEINWDDCSNSFLQNTTNSLPRILQEKFIEEPLYIDLRFANSAEDVSLSNPIFKKEILKIAAELHGKEPKDIASEEVVQHKRVLRIRNVAIAILVLLLSISVVLAWVANIKNNEAQQNLETAKKNERRADANALIARSQRDSAILSRKIADYNAHIAQLQRDTAKIQKEKAIRQEQIAINERNRAQANYFMFEAKSALKSNPTIALRLAQEANLAYRSPELQAELLKMYYENSFYKIIGHVSPHKDNYYIKPGSADERANRWFTYSPDGTKAFELDYSESNFKWDLPLPRIIKQKTVKDADKKYDFTPSLSKFSPDGQYIIYSPAAGSFGVVNLAGKHLLSINLKGERSPVRLQYDISTGTFSPDSKKILIRYHSNVQLWTLEDKKIVKQFEKGIKGVILTSDGGKIILTYSDGEAQTFNWDGKILSTFHGHTQRVNSFDFSHDNAKVLTASSDSTIRLWTANGKQEKIFRGLQADVFSAKFSPDDRYIVSVSDTATVDVWNAQGDVIQKFICPSSVKSVRFSEDQQSIITFSRDRIIRKWPLKLNIIKRYDFKPYSFSYVGLLNNGFLTSSTDSFLRLWNYSGNLIKQIKVSSGAISIVAVSQDQNKIITIQNSSYLLNWNGDYGSEAKVWDINGNLIKTIKSIASEINNVKFSPSGKLIFLGTSNGRSELWSSTGKLIRTLETGRVIYDIIFSRDERKIIFQSGDDRFVENQGCDLSILNLKNNKVIKLIDGYPEMYDIKFLKNEKVISAFVIQGGETLMWSANGQSITSNKCKNCNWDDPDLLEIPENTIPKFEFNLLKNSRVLDDFSSSNVAFSNDKKTILTVTPNGEITFWKMQIPVNEFLKSDKIEALTAEDKKKYKIN